MAIQLLPEEEFRASIPAELHEVSKSKDADKSEQVFPHRLWKILQWVGNDQVKRTNMGCGWMSENEFFIEKSRFCQILEIKLNTLNFKLRSCKFQQSRQRHGNCTYWVCEKFSQKSTIQDLESVDLRRNASDDTPSVVSEALYLPLLSNVRLYSSATDDVQRFKMEAILEWQEIVGSIWATDVREFIVIAAKQFCASYRNNSETFNFNAEQTEIAQYLRSNGLDLLTTAIQMLNYVILTEKPNIITIVDFCLFYARFGPTDCILEKIHQLLCCSKTYEDWFQPSEQKFDRTKSVSGSYSNTFANCFVIKRAQGATYHVYNLPLQSTKTGFLVDETAKKFLTWHAVFESFIIPQQPVVGYSYHEEMP